MSENLDHNTFWQMKKRSKSKICVEAVKKTLITLCGMFETDTKRILHVVVVLFIEHSGNVQVPL